MQENQRIRLTKQLLKQSLTMILRDTSIHKVSVRTICESAQINRTTFYKYYGSQYDLLLDMENDVLEEIEACLKDIVHYTEETQIRLKNVISYINDNLELCRLLMNNNTDPEFPEKLIRLPAIKNSMDQLYDSYENNELEYVFDFVVNGGFAILKQWINKENRESPEEMAEILSKIVFRVF